MHLSQYFSLRFTPHLAFSSRSLVYQFNTYEGPKEYTKLIESTIITLPLSIKYKSVRVNNFSAYILLGGAYAIDLASNAGVENLSSDPNDVIVAIKERDILGEIGFGTDFYLEYFKFGVELKLSTGLKNVLIQENTQFSTPIDKLRTKMWTLSFTFEG